MGWTISAEGLLTDFKAVILAGEEEWHDTP